MHARLSALCRALADDLGRCGILKPAGIFVYDTNFSGQRQRAANLAALLEVFPVVLEHPEGVVLASQQPITIAPGREPNR